MRNPSLMRYSIPRCSFSFFVWIDHCRRLHSAVMWYDLAFGMQMICIIIIIIILVFGSFETLHNRAANQNQWEKKHTKNHIRLIACRYIFFMSNFFCLSNFFSSLSPSRWKAASFSSGLYAYYIYTVAVYEMNSPSAFAFTFSVFQKIDTSSRHFTTNFSNRGSFIKQRITLNHYIIINNKNNNVKIWNTHARTHRMVCGSAKSHKRMLLSPHKPFRFWCRTFASRQLA